MGIVQAIGVGCRRSGSSFLHDSLNKHPDIRKPLRGVHYFSLNYDRGSKWYEEEVAKAGGIAPISIEFSVSYMYPEYCEIAASRAYAYNPDAKIFATLRHPVDRAFSDFLRSQRNAEIPIEMSFESALEMHPEFLDRGRYKTLLRSFIELYGSENIHIMVYEDLAISVEQFLTPLHRFLGVRPIAFGETRARAAEAGRGVSNQKLQEMIMYVKRVSDDAADRVGLQDSWAATKRILRVPYKWLRAANTEEVIMRQCTRERLLEEFRVDIEWVQSITGRELALWHK